MARRPQPGTGKFLGTAVLLMVLFAAPSLFVPKKKTVVAPTPTEQQTGQKADMSFMQMPSADVLPEFEDQGRPAGPEAKPEETLAWKRYALPFTVPADVPRIAIIIDDMGEYRHNLHAVYKLPGPLTLAYLPYPKDIAAMVAEGRAAGDEIMMHMPMESVSGELAKFDYVLRDGMKPEELKAILVKNLDSFDGYIGINNHMGSQLTQNKEAMRAVMEELKKRGLAFIDSRTIGSSVGEETASEFGLAHASRNIFLDDTETAEAVRAQLAKVEAYARKHGHAIAIGHPKDQTIAELAAWLPTLQNKGFVLVPVSSVLVTPAIPQSQAPQP